MESSDAAGGRLNVRLSLDASVEASANRAGRSHEPHVAAGHQCVLSGVANLALAAGVAEGCPGQVCYHDRACGLDGGLQRVAISTSPVISAMPGMAGSDLSDAWHLGTRWQGQPCTRSLDGGHRNLATPQGPR
ncbi:MAG TPA: hypothetical protein VHJ18_02500 [Streptosporangiaceae bacterium]|nr:hypothetical protein [Streptosporangiaceae bacterium]